MMNLDFKCDFKFILKSLLVTFKHKLGSILDDNTTDLPY